MHFFEQTKYLTNHLRPEYPSIYRRIQLNELSAASKNIEQNESEKQFEIIGKSGKVDVPYIELTTDAGRLAQVMRLIRKDVEHDTIIAFHDMFLVNLKN